MGADAAAEEQFGPYLVYERLGVGGMATVHRALERDASGYDRVVALKRLLPHLAEDTSFIKAFVREAKLASLLTHINIVEIYELGRVGTEYFISMEYIDGHDLRRVLRHARRVTGPPPIHITAGLILQLCDALEYAHTRVDEDGNPLGLVHRDVSPSNLLVTSSGHLKVIDFGIAKAQSSQLRTQTGRVKGKLAYMAPEAVSGSRELDARSDIWAAGVILHELLTARPLFASKNEYQTLLKVQRGDIMPPSTFNQACPPELDAIVFKALARDPDERFSSADELRAEVDDVRLRYQLQAGYRDVAGWLEWAFSLETPAGFSGNSLEPSLVSPMRERTPRPPRNRDDDEAVDMVWGTGDADATSGPLALDDVPDVSEKHLARSDTEASLEDDIPTPQPSHGRSFRNLSRAETTLHTDADGEPITAPVAPPMTERGARRPTVETDPSGAPMSSLSVDDLFGSDAEAAETVVGSLSAATADATLESMEAARDHVETPPVSVPVVRFSAQRITIPPLATSGLAPLRPPPQTKPGVQPASAHVRAPKPKPSAPMIGAAIVERETKPSRRGWLLLAGLAIVGGAATALTLVLTTGGDPVASQTSAEPRVPIHDTGTVTFLIEPADAEIRIEGQLHTGSPWSAELASGIHQIEIRRTGYKARVTSIELSAKETQTFNVALEPLGTTSNDATLSVSTTPAGLDVVLDGAVLPHRTPIKLMSLKPGPHAIAVRRDGTEVWHQSIKAEASSDYDFNPSFTAAKQRERAERAKPKAMKPPSPTGNDPAPVLAHDPAPVPAHNPDLEPIDQTAPPDAATSPLTVPTAAVTKLSGELPNLAKLELPPEVSAKVCIDTFGAVSSVDLVDGSAPPFGGAAGRAQGPAVDKIDHHAADELAVAIQSWKYAPYKKSGVALSVCFAVTLRVK